LPHGESDLIAELGTDQCFAYPGEIRKVIYTRNTIELLNMPLRKLITMRGGSFHNEDSNPSRIRLLG
jgi:transposase-like protein